MLKYSFYKKAGTDRPLSFAFVVTTTSLAFVVSQLDVSIVNIALPPMAESLHAQMSQLQWIVDAYTVAFAVMMLSAGGMSDLLGPKHLFRTGIWLFGIASLGCGLSWNPGLLIAFRMLQGIGSAAMIPSSLTILNQSFAHDAKKRAKAIALWTAAGSTSIALGPLIGGIILHYSHWSMIFYVNVPICIAGIIASSRFHEGERYEGRGFDIPGQLFWMLSITLLIATIIEVPEYGFQHVFIRAGLMGCIASFLIFLLIEMKTVSPILPLSLFRSAKFNVLILVGMCVNGGYYGIVFILSLYLQDVLGYSTLSAGLAFIPLTIGLTLANFISGSIMVRWGTRLPIIIGLLVFAIGFLLLLVVADHTPYWQLFTPFLLIPMGMGLVVPAMTTTLLASVPKRQSGTASAVLNTTRQSSGAIGVAVFGAMANGGAKSIVYTVLTGSYIAAGVALSILVLALLFVRTN